MSLPANVDALEVVPLPLGRRDAVAREQDGDVVQGDLLLAVGRRTDGDLLTLSELHRAGGRQDAHRRSGNVVRLQQGNALCPLPLAVDDLATRLESGRLELLRQILDGLSLACRRRAAPFEAVVGQDADMLAQLRLIELGLLSGGRHWQGKGDRGRCNPTHSLHFDSPQS